MAPHGVYRCAGDAHWVSIAVRDQDEWARFAALIGQPALVEDARFVDLPARVAHREELDALVTAWTSTRADYDVMRELQAAGIAAMPSLRSDQIVDDPHLDARGFIQRLQHDLVGPITLMNVPWKMSGSPGHPPQPGPMLGEHNGDVLGGLLGLSDEEIAALVAEQVVF